MAGYAYPDKFSLPDQRLYHRQGIADGRPLLRGQSLTNHPVL